MGNQVKDILSSRFVLFSCEGTAEGTVIQVLYDNDLDYRLARLLAAQVFAVPAFTPIPQQTYDSALETLRRCQRVILAGSRAEIPNAPLLAQAQALGIPIQRE